MREPDQSLMKCLELQLAVGWKLCCYLYSPYQALQRQASVGTCTVRTAQVEVIQ
jgi:hypothetical protein